jgi:phosphoglycolate phosphatase-like HAD superfamily hydrolase
MKPYIGMISSDWNQCLAPCGPFDVFAYHHPGLQRQLDRIFQHYTSNAMTLGEAAGQIRMLLPSPLTQNQMDRYLLDQFKIYTGVEEFIAWCRDHHILFMINTTGMTGYFQRALALGLLPAFAVLSANPLVRYDQSATDPGLLLDLFEITDKARHTAAVAARFNIAPNNIIIVGDSGGDGPHFEWGAHNGATLIGSMTKSSLETYCAGHGIAMTYQFGHTYAMGEAVDLEKEMVHTFTDLIAIVQRTIDRQC